MEPFLVNQTRWSDLIKNLSVAKGLDHVEVLASLTAALILENDRPEHKYLSGESLAAGQNLLAALGAGVTGFIGLRNPSGSGKIVILEAIRAVRSGVTDLGRLYVALSRAAVWTQVNTEQPLDTRIQPTGAFGTAAPNIAGQVVTGRSDTITVTPFVIAEILAGYQSAGTVAAAVQGYWDSPVVLAPGDTLSVHPSDGAGGNTANLAFEVSFVWRERTLEPTET